MYEDLVIKERFSTVLAFLLTQVLEDTAYFDKLESLFPLPTPKIVTWEKSPTPPYNNLPSGSFREQ